MSKRLQLLLDEAELKAIRRAARAQQLTVSEWVRQALRAARRQKPVAGVGKKLGVVRAASRHSFPTADMDQILAEIERGFIEGRER